MTADPLKLLFVEDSELDAELEEVELRKGGLVFHSRRVEEKIHLERQLKEWQPDLVISDFSMPTLTGIDVLGIVRAHMPEVPFIFCSGTIGEERAIEAMKRGATDYVVKDRLTGLVVRVKRAIEEARERSRRKKLEEELRQAQKMDALGRLAGAVAHDFNNLLTAMLSFGELALRKLKPDDPVRADVEEMYGAAESASGLTRQLLSFSRKSPTVLRAVEINAVVSTMAKLLGRLLGRDIAIQLKLAPSLRPVQADAGGLEQILLNLCVNARDAMPKGGTLTIETLPTPEHVVLKVTDTGTGIDPQVLPRIFEPFFTTKAEGKGTGLGLATVYGLSQAFGGTVSVSSEVGAGTSFSVSLKEASTPEGGSPATVTIVRPRLSAGSETIIVAEDSLPIRMLITQVLGTQGYKVLEAADGAVAHRLASEYPGDIHLLLTDVVMPGLGGFELAARLRESRPKLKVLLLSGLTDESQLEGYKALAKPFTPIRLSQAVRQVLDQE